MVTLSRSLADLGLAVYVPDLPGFREDRLTGTALTALGADIRCFAGFRHVRGHEVSLMGIGAGASLAILAAAGNHLQCGAPSPSIPTPD